MRTLLIIALFTLTAAGPPMGGPPMGGPPGRPPCWHPQTPPCTVPIDGGIGLLIAAAVGLGIKKLKK